MLKRILKGDGVRAVLCWLGAQYIRLVWTTGRWRVENDAEARRRWETGKPFILAFWHGHLLMMPCCWPPERPMRMLTSRHRDGQIIARVIRRFGIATASGSSTRGGAAASKRMLTALRGGECVGVTPDGPRGPRMRAAAGVVRIARMSGAPILPCAAVAGRRKQLKTWDRFQVALPFSRGLVRWGDPIAVGADDDMEAARLRVETAMTVLADGAEAAMGHTPTAPEPLRARSEKTAPGT